MSQTDEKTRYTADELAEFKVNVDKKLAEARSDLELLKASLLDEARLTESLSQSEGETPLRVEEVRQLITRQQKYIGHLEDALVRIGNGTYGVCRVTGALISKERLRLVPWVTQNIAPKTQPQP